MEGVASCRCFHHVGPPEHDPGAMLKLLVYGYSYGIRSSRKLERATYHNLSFIWLMGGLKLDHKTISRFRRNNRSALQQVLRQCVRLSLQLGLIEGSTLFVDGTQISANASLSRGWTRDRCERYLRKVDRQIEGILDECEAVDRSERGDGSWVRMGEELKNADELK